MSTVQYTAAAHVAALDARDQALAGLISGESSLRTKIDGYKGDTLAWIGVNQGGTTRTKEATEAKAKEVVEKYFTLKTEIAKLAAFSRDLQAGIEATRATPITPHDLNTLKFLSPKLEATATELETANTGKSEHLKAVKDNVDTTIESNTERLRLLAFEVDRIVKGAADATGLVPGKGVAYRLGVAPTIVDTNPGETDRKLAEVEKALTIAEENFVAEAPTDTTKSFKVSHDESIAKIRAQDAEHFVTIKELGAVVAQLEYFVSQTRAPTDLTKFDLTNLERSYALLKEQLIPLAEFNKAGEALEGITKVLTSYLLHIPADDGTRAERKPLSEKTIETLQKLSPELKKQALAAQTVWTTKLHPEVVREEAILRARVENLNAKLETANALMEELARFISAVKGAQPAKYPAAATTAAPTTAITAAPTTAITAAPTTAATTAAGGVASTQ